MKSFFYSLSAVICFVFSFVVWFLEKRGSYDWLCLLVGGIILAFIAACEKDNKEQSKEIIGSSSRYSGLLNNEALLKGGLIKPSEKE